MDSKYKEWYEAAQTKAGEQEGLLIFNTPEEHRLKWNTISYLIDKATPSNVPSPTLLDVGCGYSDLVQFIPEGKYRYTGIDAIEWIYDFNKKLNPELAVFHIDLAGYIATNPLASDVVVALGVMATLSEDDEDNFIDQLVSVSRYGIVISFQDVAKYTGSFRSFSEAHLRKKFAFHGLDMICFKYEWETETYAVIAPRGSLL